MFEMFCKVPRWFVSHCGCAESINCHQKCVLLLLDIAYVPSSPYTRLKSCKLGRHWSCTTFVHSLVKTVQVSSGLLQCQVRGKDMIQWSNEFSRVTCQSQSTETQGWALAWAPLASYPGSCLDTRLSTSLWDANFYLSIFLGSSKVRNKLWLGPGLLRLYYDKVWINFSMTNEEA